jgi:hypothetical protein
VKKSSQSSRRGKLARARKPRKSRRRVQLVRRDGDDDDILGALHPFKLYRTGTLAKLLCVDRATI